MKNITGYSKLSKKKWGLAGQLPEQWSGSKGGIISYWHRDLNTQKVCWMNFLKTPSPIISFRFPLPNFFNQRWLLLFPPMAKKEKFGWWPPCRTQQNSGSTRGGFKTEILGTTKIGQVHFIYKGDEAQLKADFQTIKAQLLEGSYIISFNMEQIGGGWKTLSW